LLAPWLPEAAAVVSAIDHSSVAMATLAFARADLGDVSGASGCLVPRDQGTVMTAASFATSKWAQLRDPARDDVILRVSAGRVGDERHRDLDDEALLATVLADLDRVVGVSGEPTHVRIGRWQRSLPQYAPGHLDRMDQVEAALAGTGVVAAGMWLRGVGIPACVRSAEAAAASLGATWPTRRSLAR
jgi:oxygen-dependent protoporphyrinogen oxidase